jgi:hypothetical protein
MAYGFSRWIKWSNGDIRTIPACNLSVGQVVQHKVTGMRAVIVDFGTDNDGHTMAYVTVGFNDGDSFRCYAAEIEPAKSADAVAKG